MSLTFIFIFKTKGGYCSTFCVVILEKNIHFPLNPEKDIREVFHHSFLFKCRKNGFVSLCRENHTICKEDDGASAEEAVI